MLKKLVSLFFFASFFFAGSVTAQTPDQPAPDVYYKAEVTNILSESVEETPDGIFPSQKVELRILNGDEKGKTITIDHGDLFVIKEEQKVTTGDLVIITKPGSSPKPDFYYISDWYRTNGILIILAIFVALAIFFGRKKGLTSLLGLGFTILVIFYGMVPAIIRGTNPLTVAVIGALTIAVISLYLSHGFSKRTSVALLSTVITLVLAFVLDVVFVYLAKLSGTGSEESFYLQFDMGSIDLRGLLLAGILLGVLGVLDDVTTAQSAAVEELQKANNSLSITELYQRGLSIGREHIASLINTLVLAYVGVSFPLILLFALNKTTPLWITLNSNFIAEEIVRALVGSSTLILAVPITTFLAAYFYTRTKRAA